MPNEPSTNTYETINYNMFKYGFNSPEGNGIKPLAPSSSVYKDSNGSDSNDGFSPGSPVQSLSKVEEILETYNWGGSFINLYLGDGLNLGTLNLINVTGADEINIRDSINTGVIFENFRLGRLDFFSTSINSALTCRDVYRLNFNNCQFNGSGSANIQQCYRLTTDNTTYNNLTNTRVWTLSNSFLATFDPGGFVGGNFTQGFLRIIDGGVNTLRFAAGASGTVTGILVNVEDLFGVTTPLVHYSNQGTISGTLPDVFGAGTIYNNDISRGDFADDAAAGTGGVLSGHYYWNTTSNQLDRKV